MERYLGAGFRRTLVLVAVLLLCSVLTQSGFSLNIDCGATSKYVDSVTGLSWEPDAPYISSGKTQTVTLPTSLQNFTEMQTLRYFNDARVKNCYALPVTSSGIYLLQLSFFYGDYDNANLPPKFQVAIDANIISNITFDATRVSHQEYHYKSVGNVTYLCLIRTSSGATPFISGISLKDASVLATGYVKQFATFLQEGIIMTTRNRLNFGGTALIRCERHLPIFANILKRQLQQSSLCLERRLVTHDMWFCSDSVLDEMSDFSRPICNFGLQQWSQVLVLSVPTSRESPSDYALLVSISAE